jgi:hypothetical protein
VGRAVWKKIDNGQESEVKVLFSTSSTGLRIMGKK